MTYRNAVEGQQVFVKLNKWTDSEPAIFVRYYKSSPFLKQPNKAAVMMRGVTFTLDVQDIYKRESRAE
jgi:hypothetical protein